MSKDSCGGLYGYQSLGVCDAIGKFYNEGMNFLQQPKFLDRAAQFSGQQFYIDEYVRDISSESKSEIQKYLSRGTELIELIQISNQSDIEDLIKRLLFMSVPKKEIPKYTTVPKHSGSHFIV